MNYEAFKTLMLNQYSFFGYSWRIWLLWDHDRLWGRFNFGNTEGAFLVDPGVNPSLCNEDGGQELPFRWRGVQGLKPNILYCNELVTKGKIHIWPRMQKIEGFFEYMDGDGSTGERPGEKCAFQAEAYYKPPVVPYTLEETVELWNYYSPVSLRTETVRQFLPPSEVNSDLVKREWVAVVTIDSEVSNDGEDVIATGGKGDDDDLLVAIGNDGENDERSMISTNENGDDYDDVSLVAREPAGTQETVTEVT